MRTLLNEGTYKPSVFLGTALGRRSDGTMYRRSRLHPITEKSNEVSGF